MKLYEVMNFIKIYNKLANAKLPLQTLFNLSSIRKFYDGDINFYQEQVSKIVNKYAARDSKGEIIYTDNNQNIQIKKEFIEDCQKELNELSNIDVKEPLNKIKLSSLGDVSFTLEEIDLIYSFLEE